MSGPIRFSTARRQTRATQHADWLTGGSMEIYDGTKPDTTDTAISTQVLLLTYPLPDPIGTTSNGATTVNAIAPALVVASGTHVATWGRTYDSSGVVIADYDVGVTGSNNPIELDSTDLTQGASVSVTSFAVAEG